MTPRLFWYLALAVLVVPYLDTLWQTVSRPGNRYLSRAAGLRIALGFVEAGGLAAAVLLERSGVPWLRWLGSLASAGAWIGAALALSGAAVAAWARIALGRFFTAYLGVKVGHRLIRSGPYAWVRNPIYLGILLFLLGTALCFDSLPFLALTAVLWFCFRIQAWVEERAFAAHFGAEYAAYRREVPALLPRLRGRGRR